MKRKKKKVNSNNIPISIEKNEIMCLVMRSTEEMTFRAWLLVLGAYADFPEASQKQMLDLWEKANHRAGSVHTQDDMRPQVIRMMEEVGITLPYRSLSTDGIRTLGDLERFIRRAERNGLYSSFALVVEPLVAFETLPEATLMRLFRKAWSLNDELKTDRITLQDLQGVLEDEYKLRLEYANGKMTMHELP